MDGEEWTIDRKNIIALKERRSRKKRMEKKVDDQDAMTTVKDEFVQEI